MALTVTTEEQIEAAAEVIVHQAMMDYDRVAMTAQERRRALEITALIMKRALALMKERLNTHQ